MGIGHLLTELPFAFKILSERNVKGLIFIETNLHQKIFRKYFIKKLFLFIIFLHIFFFHLF